VRGACEAGFPAVFKDAVSPGIIGLIADLSADERTPAGDAVTFLEGLRGVSRFEMNAMLLPKKTKEAIKAALARGGAEAEALRKAYRV